MRLVSLVPSLTESVAHTGFLVGATDYCVHPAGLDVARVGAPHHKQPPQGPATAGQQTNTSGVKKDKQTAIGTK